MKPQREQRGSGKPKGPRTNWDGVAGSYDRSTGDEGSAFQTEVVFPAALRLLALRAGDRVLDVGCGQGAFCRILRQQNAEVTGVDASRQLIRRAKERSDPSIQYLVADCRELAAMPELAGRFTAAACILAIQNMDPLRPVCEGIGACLAPQGRLVIVMNHPVFRAPHCTSWGWDERQQAQYRRIDAYLSSRKEKILMHPGSAPASFTWSFHRPLQAYVKALSRAGLLVDALEEWVSHKLSDSGPRARAENVARREIPLFLALRAVKVPPGTMSAQPPAMPSKGEVPAPT
jgi:SAM-dependent methyltransferase